MNKIALLKYLPMLIFIVYARFNGMTDLAWRGAFIAGGIAALISTVIQLHKNVLFNRLMLGVNLFLLVGAIAFLADLDGILMFYGSYEGASLLACIGIVGVLTTLFTDACFIGVDYAGKTKVKKRYSLILLGINAIVFVWALYMNEYGLFVSAVIPFVILRVAYEEFGKKIKKIE